MKTLQGLKKVLLYLLNCAIFNPFFVYETLHTNQKEVKDPPAWG
jgi:hypothetical protein